MKYVILIGGPVRGYEAHGPFEGREAAMQFGSQTYQSDWWALPLHAEGPDETLAADLKADLLALRKEADKMMRGRIRETRLYQLIDAAVKHVEPLSTEKETSP